MRVRTDELFRATEAMRMRIDELELELERSKACLLLSLERANNEIVRLVEHVRVMDHALKLANNDNVALARRIKYLERFQERLQEQKSI
jgi:hypothetical protein